MGLQTPCQKQITCKSLKTNTWYFYPIIWRENTSCFFLMKNRWNVFYLLLYKHFLHFFMQWHLWLSQWVLSRQFHTQYKEPSLLQSHSSGKASLFASHIVLSAFDFGFTSVTWERLQCIRHVFQEFEIKFFFSSLSFHVFEKCWKGYLCSGFLVIWYFEHVTTLSRAISVDTEGVW